MSIVGQNIITGGKDVPGKPVPELSPLFGLPGSHVIDGTANQVVITDDGDGTVTASAPQDLATTSTPTFSGIKGKNRTKIYFYAGF